MSAARVAPVPARGRAALCPGQRRLPGAGFTRPLERAQCRATLRGPICHAAGSAAGSGAGPVRRGPDAPAAAAAPVSAPPAGAPAQQAEPALEAAAPFSWEAQWWPVLPVAYLDPRKPHPVRMLGKRYVAWFDRAAPDGGAWRLVDDMCPHRLSPLSESRIRADGRLTCAYHGWSFDGSGACTNIPQLGDPKARATACASSRTCVASYPTAVEDGLLFAWLERGPRGAAAAAADLEARGGRLIAEEVAGAAARTVWASHEVPNDYLYWAEQGLDPSHANWLHHDEIGFYMDDATPMDADVIPTSAIDPASGFEWRHSEYRAQGKGVDARRAFRAPNCLITRYAYPGGKKQAFQIFVVPIVPGTCRIFFQEGRGAPAGAPPPPPAAIQGAAKVEGGAKGALAPLPAPLPFWDAVKHARSLAVGVLDQDVVIMAGQARTMGERSLGRRDYAMYARADEGILALHKWAEGAGYAEMWQRRMEPAALAAAQAEAASVTEERALDKWRRHTKDCAACQRVYAACQLACKALLCLSAAFAAAALFASSQAAGAASAVLLGLAGAAYYARERLAWFAQWAFVSSQARWRRRGGLTLVAGPAPVIKL